MSLQLLQKVQDLRCCLELILDRLNDIEKAEFIDRSIEATGHAKRMVSTIIDTYNIEKENQTLTQYGSSLLNLLIEFQQTMSVCRIVADEKGSITL